MRSSPSRVSIDVSSPLAVVAITRTAMKKEIKAIKFEIKFHFVLCLLAFESVIKAEKKSLREHLLHKIQLLFTRNVCLALLWVTIESSFSLMS